LKKFDRFNKDGSRTASSENKGSEFKLLLFVKSLNAGRVKMLDLNFLWRLDKLNNSSCFLK